MTTSRILADLRAASQHLRDTGAPALARTVDTLLAPTGWKQLRKAVEAENGQARNVAIPINEDLRAAYQKAAEDAGSNLTDDVLAGLFAFTTGEFSPAGYPRRDASSPDTGTFLNVRVPDSLKQAVAAAAEARRDEIRYKASLPHIAKAWLAHTYSQPAK
ncbi:hypothetical protein [Streptomyces hydrogenans]|uniref:hypothetical protein n=1 Tax=Streptomyces hydrogenans TaxID=1873719 RepID=UPI0036E7838D